MAMRDPARVKTRGEVESLMVVALDAAVDSSIVEWGSGHFFNATNVSIGRLHRTLILHLTEYDLIQYTLLLGV